MNKIFGIGLGHTGTTSLNSALNILGIKSYHCPLDMTTYKEISGGKYELTVLKHYQAITDVTTVPIYPQLDTVYPGSKFILTIREKQAWLKSMKRVNKMWLMYLHKNRWQKFWIRFNEERPLKGRRLALKSAWNRVQTDQCLELNRLLTYGGLAFQDERRLAYVYDQHYKGVLAYFKDRQQDLLVMNICEGEEWAKLCPFLNKDIPNQTFPHSISQKFHPTLNQTM